MSFENIEGVILVHARLQGTRGRDTSALLALDTGAGFVALDHPLAVELGLSDSTEDRTRMHFTRLPLRRMELGSLELDQVSPVLSLDAAMIRQVTDRPVAGLLGQHVFADRALWIDYRANSLAVIPVARTIGGDDSTRGRTRSSRAQPSRRIARSREVFGSRFSRRSIALPFNLAGDGKILVRARVSNPRPPRYSDWLTWIVDTGATKSVLFEEALGERIPRAGDWAALRGLSAPTLIGTTSARIVLIPAVELWTGTAPPRKGTSSKELPLEVASVDVVVIRTELAGQLSEAVGEQVHGLLGYSFLKHFRVGLDYPNRIMWLDPLPSGWEDRPYEYSHVGIQIERRGNAVQVVGVADGSPAARAGVVVGDEVVGVDELSAATEDLTTLARRLEGPPGTKVRLSIRRGSGERTYSLARRRLL